MWTKFFLPFVFIVKAQAADAPATCYRFLLPESPATSASIVKSRPETWCYQQVSQPAMGLYIYNADGEEVRPELSILVEPDGVVTHGSLLAGEVTIHRIRSAQYNPFSVPLEEPLHITSISNFKAVELQNSATENLKFLMSQTPVYEDLAVQEGRSSASSRTKPWRGYWWSYKSGSLAGTSSSPLAKYDRFVAARTGSSPRAASWERTYHKYKGIWWEGHCNGWAASSVLRAQPHAKKDSRSGVSFSVSDIKGILAETDYCANVAFFGRRYNGRRGDNIKDINPGTFHRTLTYYIGNLGKPVAIDYRRDTAVDNHVISAYTMDVTKTGDNTYSVRTVLTVHKYDGSRSNNPGTAPSYTRTYSYNLRENTDGSLTGTWRSTNPDFLWVPLSPADCGSNNPRISHSRVAELLAL